MIRVIQEIKTLENMIIIREKKKKELETYMNEQILNVFFKFEENILSTIGSAQNKDLLALSQRYPELESSKHLLNLVNDVKNLVDNIYRAKEGIENKKEEIRIYLSNPWFLFKLNIKDDVLNNLA
jgi:hypothetical protein